MEKWKNIDEKEHDSTDYQWNSWQASAIILCLKGLAKDRLFILAAVQRNGAALAYASWPAMPVRWWIRKDGTAECSWPSRWHLPILKITAMQIGQNFGHKAKKIEHDETR